MGRVKRSKKSKCRTCMAITHDGTLCKRLASCQLGCKLFCWQHAKRHETGTSCKSPRIKSCKKGCDPTNQQFPCLKKRTIFRSEKEFRKYCDLKASRKVRAPIKRKKRLALARKDAELEAKNLEQKQTVKRRVRFAV